MTREYERGQIQNKSVFLQEDQHVNLAERSEQENTRVKEHRLLSICCGRLMIPTQIQDIHTDL